MKREQTSRRRFLKSALLGAASAAGAKGMVAAETVEARASDPERERLHRLVARYGSELGDLRKAGR